MRIENPLPSPYEVEDFNFTFANGVIFPLTLYKGLGDTIDWDANRVRFIIASKPSILNPEHELPPGEVTIMMQHVIMVEHRKRTVQPPSKEETDFFYKTLHKQPKLVQ